MMQEKPELRIDPEEFNETPSGLLRKVKNRKIFSSKKEIFVDALFQSNGNLSQAARLTGVHYQTCVQWMRRMDIAEKIRERLSMEETERSRSAKKLWSDLWDVWEGRVKKDKYQMQSAVLIGKILGMYKEKVQHESYSKSEIAFSQADVPPENLPARESGDGQLLEGQVRVPDGWQAFRENNANALLAPEGVREENGAGVVRGSIQSPGEGNSVASASRYFAETSEKEGS